MTDTTFKIVNDHLSLRFKDGNKQNWAATNLEWVMVMTPKKKLKAIQSLLRSHAYNEISHRELLTGLTDVLELKENK